MKQANLSKEQLHRREYPTKALRVDLMKTLNLAFGALCPLVSEQVRQQFPELKHDDAKLRFFDRSAENIVFLRIHSLITGAESNRANKRVMKQVADYLNTLM